MRHVWNFFTGLTICLIFLLACAPDQQPAALSTENLPAAAGQVSYNLYDVIKLILATFGGVATTILLTFLKARYPKLFGSLKIPTDQNQNST